MHQANDILPITEHSRAQYGLDQGDLDLLAKVRVNMQGRRNGSRGLKRNQARLGERSSLGI